MFGKPEWFRPKRIGWGLVPVTWQGWAYTGVWLLVIAAPFWVLTERHQAMEATAWLVFGIGALVYDVREVLKGIHGPTTAVAAKNAAREDDGILYINDSGAATSPVATRNYNLRLK